MLVPPQLRIILLFKLNLAKEIRYRTVCGQEGKKIKALRDHLWKYISRALGVLDITPGNKIR